MGIGLPYTASAPAISQDKVQECLRAGAAVRKLLELDLKPRDIMTKKAFENAITLMHVLGGSTNVVLHLIAAAKAADVDISVDDCEPLQDLHHVAWPDTYASSFSPAHWREDTLPGRHEAERQIRHGGSACEQLRLLWGNAHH